MLNRDGIRKTSYGPVTQILADIDNQFGVGCIVPQSMGVDVGHKKIVKAGTPVNINLMDTMTPVKAPASSISESATATVSGTGITGATVTAATFGSKVSGSGSYEFTYDGSSWKFGGNEVTLSNYGITASGTAASGDKITVVYVAAGSAPMNAVLIHDVDVTDGAANGSALIFGFVNVNRLEADVQVLVAQAMAGAGRSQLLTFVKL